VVLLQPRRAVLRRTLMAGVGIGHGYADIAGLRL
jgi:hypothetical protein